jgi:hypothetical protein
MNHWITPRIVAPIMRQSPISQSARWKREARSRDRRWEFYNMSEIPFRVVIESGVIGSSFIMSQR